MTSILAAAVAVSWVAIVLLFLGYTALLTQIKELRTVSSTDDNFTYPELAASTSTSRTVVLVVSATCATCEQVLPSWLAIAPRLTAAGHRTVLLSIDDSTVWTDRGAPSAMLGSELSAPLLLAYQPALLLIDASGRIESAEPVGSATRLEDMCASLLDLVSP
ncbi:hypothetical protein [Micromonospora sp. NPDC049282]|uniref:hypothetical protein n=1 Tax=Micromonospora sp. NPDC049282 TaxID=3364269 RepID=UPI00371943DC